MTTTITPIETTYAGHRFRSRLEARWAVFLDTLRVEWRYEDQGYLTAAGPYLPDFYLPTVNGGIFVEVKGGDTSLAEDADRLDAFATESDRTLLILGDVPQMLPDRAPTHTLIRAGIPTHAAAPSLLVGDSGHLIVLALRASQPARTHTEQIRGLQPSAAIREAYRAARSARFEHGESGRPSAPRVTPPAASTDSRVRAVGAVLQRALDAHGDARHAALGQCARELHELAHAGGQRIAWHQAGGMLRDVARQIGLTQDDATEAIRAAMQS